jgi:hypothetical protein
MAALTANYGTLSTFDTLAANYQNIAQIGEDRAFEAIDMALAAHNLQVQLLRGELCETTTDRLRRYGNPTQMKMVELDEFGSPDSQKILAGVMVGFPLRAYGASLQWNRKYFQNATGKELAAQITSMMDADVQNTILQIKKALFSPVNYTDDDRLVDHLNAIQLPVKALANADGAGLPVGPNGEIFNGSTHTHYLAVTTGGTLTTTDANALLNTVLEHFATGNARVNINRNDEATWRALTGFVPYFDPAVVQPITSASAPTVPLNLVNLNNRAIGRYLGAEIWVKPWMISGYAHAWVMGNTPPLCLRVRDAATDALLLVSDDEEHPLRAKQYEREFGVGVYNRVNSAVLDMLHSTTYAAPTVT